MHRHPLLRRAGICAAVGTVSLLALAPVKAETPGSATLPAARSAPRAAECRVTADQVRLDVPLVRTARLLAGGAPIRIVALGSSSTYGAGASTSAASYPSRLAGELARHFPGHDITVVNRGVNGDTAADMLARLDTAVIAERPDLVLWQVGTNSVLRDQAVLPHATVLYEGLKRLKASGADVVLIDPQYVPAVTAQKEGASRMVKLIGEVARLRHASVFPRFEVMRQWHEDEKLPFESFSISDGLHMNDWGYACFAQLLGDTIIKSVGEAKAEPGAEKPGSVISLRPM
jgi:lysophospholipase L1-like esterase